SSFDTVLAVYTGSTLAGLVPVASNDDTEGHLTSSLVSFNASAGTSYQIAVDGFGGSSGDISLSVSFIGPQQPPPNDGFENRAALTGATVSLQTVNIGATKQAGEPNHAANSGGSSIWYTWTAPFNGKAN